jgi:tetratricopeptide (TPR) repeat protein
MLASIQLKREHQAAAERLYAKASENAANAPETYFLEGMLRHSQGQFSAAAEAYDSVYTLMPSRIVAIRSFEARTGAGQANATEALKSWVSANPTDIDGLFALSAATEQQGDIVDAIEQYEKLLRTDPDHASALNNLAMLYYQQGDSRALETAERAYRSAGDHPAILDTLGWLHIEDGNLNRGLTLLQSAAARSPEAEIQYHLAVANAKSGNTIQARSILEGLLSSNSMFDSHIEASALLDSLPPD